MQWKMKHGFLFIYFFYVYNIMKTFIFGERKNHRFKPIEYSTIFLKMVTISSLFYNREVDIKNNREKRQGEDERSFHCNKREMAN